MNKKIVTERDTMESTVLEMQELRRMLPRKLYKQRSKTNEEADSTAVCKRKMSFILVHDLCFALCLQPEGAELKTLTLECYLNSIKNIRKLYSLSIIPPKTDQEMEGVDLLERLKLHTDNPFLGASEMMNDLILNYKKMFNLK